MTVVSSAISESKLKLRYRETYVTEGVNEKTTAIPNGCYRGFIPVPTTTPTTTSITLTNAVTTWTIDGDQFAVYVEQNSGASDYDAWAISIRETADVVIDVSSLLPVAAGVTYFYIYIEASYNRGSTTTANYKVSDEDPKDSGSSNYNPDAVVIGRIPVTALSSTIAEWDMDSPNEWDDVFGIRTTPQPVPVPTNSYYAAGDKRYGMVDGIEKWSIPTVGQKAAMTSASTPSAGRPFAVEQESSNVWFAEPTEAAYKSLSAVTYIEVPDSIKVYIGNSVDDNGGSIPRFFDVRAFANGFGRVGQPLVGSDGGRILFALKAFGTGNNIDPDVDADANGFIDGIRIVLIFADTVDSSYTGDLFLYYGTGKQLKDLEQTPASALAVASRNDYPHAQDVYVKQSKVPAYIGTDLVISPGSPYRYLQPQLDKIYKQTAGPLPRDYEMLDLTMERRYAGKEDAQMYDSNNEFTLAVSTTTSYRIIGVNKTTAFAYINRCLVLISNNTHIRRLDLDASMSVINNIDCAANLETAVIAGEGSSGTWKIYDGCIDGDSIYLRAYETTGTNRHCVYCVDSQTVLSATKWGAKPYVFLSGTGAPPGAVLAYDRAYSIINADDTYLATNNPHIEITATSDAAIQLINRATGVITDSGAGNGIATGDYYAAGAICSDGVAVVFGTFKTTATTLVQVADGDITDLTSGIYTWTSFTENTSAPGCRDIVFDGVNFWINLYTICMALDTASDSAAFRIDPYDGVAYDDGYVGHICFDGKNIWAICFLDEVTSTEKIFLASWSASRPFYFDGTPTEYLHDIIRKEFGIIKKGESADFGGATPDELKELVFDGQDMWANMGGNAASREGIGRRLTDIKNR